MFRSLFNISFFLVALFFYSCSSSSEKPCIKRVDVTSIEEESIRSYDKDLPLNFTKHILRLDLTEGKEMPNNHIVILQDWVNKLPKGPTGENFDHEYMLIHLQYFSCQKSEEYGELIHKKMTKFEELITELNGKTNDYPDALILKSQHPCEQEDKTSDYIELSIREIKKTHIPPMTNNNEIRTTVKKDLMANEIIEVSVVVDSTIYAFYKENSK
ncbi:MAG: hypothetical protein GY810_04375 [Aureispira sp.]|nr:hypothetical protein [Aureispira sp.]